MRSELFKTALQSYKDEWSKCLHEGGEGKRVAAFLEKIDHQIPLSQHMFDVAWNHRQTEVDELTQLYAKELFNKKVVAKKASEKMAELQLQKDDLQKRVDLLEATLQSERWDKDAGFKIFFKARDTQGQWHGFEKKPEYYEVGGYWTNGGKSIYLQGDEWCDRETAINSLTSVKEQALKGGPND
ncbi:hypothetical protein [Acinetobacter sp. ANC 3882]|uniref:hypothetical protein n=1 Tax=Acinetobacter sp. ANC 3882 TaxID=2923423 RepID=UPI001F4B6A82|nr:hypothetical protein [Acinetobacter sp. ANC 3882]MCH7312889.1 hypothetical protein [Acinetobacter sp. ANC 3882]